MSEDTEHANAQLSGATTGEESNHDSLDGKDCAGNNQHRFPVTVRRSVIEPKSDNSAEVDNQSDGKLPENTRPLSGSMPADAREKALVLFPYKAEHDDELDLVEGEEIIVLQKEIEDPGWYRGEKNGKIGVFPDNFVRLVPAQRPKKPPPPSREALARSSHMSLEGSPPPPSTTPSNQSNESEPVPDHDNKPPPLPPKDSTPKLPNKSPMMGMGIGNIPNIGQLRNMLKSSSSNSPDGVAPSRSLFYVSSPTGDGEPAVLIVPEPGATVTTVLFHPTKDRAKPARKHNRDRPREVKFDESTNGDNDACANLPTQNQPSNDENVQDPSRLSSDAAPASNAPTTFYLQQQQQEPQLPPVNNNTNKPKASHADSNKAIPPQASPPHVVWEKRNSPEPSASHQPLDTESTNNQIPRRQPPAVPPPALPKAKPPPPAVPKKSAAAVQQIRNSMEISAALQSNSPEAPLTTGNSISPVPSSSTASSETVALKQPSPVVTSKSPSQQQLDSSAALTTMAARCDRLDKLVQDLRRDLSSAQHDIRRLTAELDEEKKARLSTQVDLERVRKQLEKQQAPSSSYPPQRPPPPSSSTSSESVLETTAI